MKRSTEIVILTALLALAAGITGALVGFDRFVRGTLDLQFHDTYLVIPAYLLLAAVYLLLIYLVYLPMAYREIRAGGAPRLILLIANGGLILLSTLFIRQLAGIELLSGGFTAYPPLAVIPDEGAGRQGHLAGVVINVLFVAQLFWVISLVFLSRWLERKH